MKSEAEFKKIFKKSVKYYKGFAISLAAPMLIGIPDLYVIMPGYMPVLLEAKWLGKIIRSHFHRKLQFTDMQINYINECCNVQHLAAFGLIGLIHYDEITAILVKYGTPLFYILDSSYLNECGYSKLYTKGGKTHQVFDIPKMFEIAQIPKININKPIHISHEIPCGSSLNLTAVSFSDT